MSLEKGTEGRPHSSLQLPHQGKHQSLLSGDQQKNLREQQEAVSSKA